MYQSQIPSTFSGLEFENKKQNKTLVAYLLIFLVFSHSMTKFLDILKDIGSGTCHMIFLLTQLFKK